MTLTEEDLTLAELREATTVPQRTRDRAHMIRLNAQNAVLCLSKFRQVRHKG